MAFLTLTLTWGSALPAMAGPTLSATNMSAPESYSVGDSVVPLTDIIATGGGVNVTATLSLSSPAVGSLTTGTAGPVSASFNAGTGTWTASGVNAFVNILLASVAFVPASGSVSQFSISVSITDGVDTTTGVKQVNVLPNNAPVLDSSRTPVLSAAAEDAATPSGSVGTPVASLIDAAMPAGGLDNVSDADSGVRYGIAITSVDTATCSSWYFFNGATWQTFSGVSESSALLLPASGNYRIFCQPMANFNGLISAAITFRAWDQTSGSAGSLADTTTNGGTSSFSVATDTASLTITSVNDAPVLDPSRTPSLLSLTEDSPAPSGATGTLVSTLVDFAAPAGQVDNVSDADAGAVLGIAITDLDTVNCSSWYFYDGTSWSTIGAVSPTSAFLLPTNGGYRISCVPAANFSGVISSALTFRAWDQTSGTAATFVDVSVNGGTSSFSADTDTLSLTVQSVNDAPILDAAVNLTLPGITQPISAPQGSVGAPVASLLDFADIPGGADNVTDSDSGAVAGIAVTAFDSARGRAYYSTDSGTTWLELSNIAESNALLLSASASNRLFFLPNTSVSGPLTDAFTIRAWDQTTGTSGGRGDATTNGGSTAFSTAADTISLVVTPAVITPSVPAVPTAHNGSAQVFFAKDSSRLTKYGKAKLKGLVLKYPKADRWDVTGYVQSGGASDSRSLSLARAKSVRNYLQSLGVVSKISLHVGGYPADKKLASARRVNIKVHEKAGKTAAK